MNKSTLIAALLSTVIITACGSKKSEESVVIEDVKKETYNLLTDSKEILDKAEQAAKEIEEATAKKMKEVENY